MKRLSFGDFSKDVELEKYSDEVLEATICTCDGVGEENKRLVLRELLSRKYDSGWKTGIEQATGE